MDILLHTLMSVIFLNSPLAVYICFLDRCPWTLPPFALLLLVKIACCVATVARTWIADIGSLVVIADAATRVVIAYPYLVVAVSFVCVISVATFFACKRSLDAIEYIMFTVL